MECVELLCGRRFPPKLKGVDHGSYARPAILDKSVKLCLKER